MKRSIFSSLLFLPFFALSAKDVNYEYSKDVARDEKHERMIVAKDAIMRANTNVTITATETITSTWAGGYVASITVENTSKSAISSWQVSFTLGAGQTITNNWSGIFSSASSAVAVTNESYNGSLAAGASTTFGFQVDNPQNTSSTLQLTAVGNPSSTPVQVPAAPVLNAITIASGASNYSVSWNSVANATSYTLQVSSSSSFASSSVAAQGNVTSFGVTNQPNGTYYYRVSASNSAGTSSWSSVQSVVVNSTPATLAAPVLQAISNASGSGSYAVNWNAVTNAQGYILQQSTSSSFTNPTTIYSCNTTSYQVTGNAAGTYYYRVSAFAGNSTSSQSNVVSTTVSSSPVTLTAPVLSAISNASGSGTYTINWSAVTNAQGYTLQQSTSSSFANPTTIYTGTATSFQVSGNTAGTYYYEVSAYAGSSTSPQSNMVNTTVTTAPVTLTAPVLSAISNASGSGTYTINWSAVTNAQGYTLQQSTSSSFANPTTIYTGTATSFQVSGNTAGTYYYEVSAYAGSSTSPQSNMVNTTVTTAPVTLTAPVLSAISNASGSGTYTINWSAVTNAQGYTLQQSTSSSFANPTTIYTGTATSFQVSGNTAGTYYYEVSAYAGSSTSPQSNMVNTTVNSVTPPANAPIIDGYWESWASDPVSSIVNMHVNVIDIAFANFTSLGNSQFEIAGIDADQATVTQLVTLAHAAGKQVKLSVGGASYPIAPQLQTTADAQGMAQAIATYVAANNLDGVDIDIEDNTAATLQIALFQNLRQLMPNALITYAPETPVSTSQPYADVVKGAYQYMSYFSMQDYNNYSGYNYQNDIATMLSWGVPASKICVGMMPGADDEGMQTSVAKITSISQYVLQNGLKGVMFWDLNRDLDNETGLGADAATNAAYAVFNS